VLILNVKVPGEPTRRVRVDRPVLSLGRASTNDVPLGDRTLSRAHARIERTVREDGGETVLLVDLGSRNGTALNGTRLSAPAALKAGDRIRLGETTLEISDESTTRVYIDGRHTSSPDNTVLRTSTELLKSPQDLTDADLGKDELARLAMSLRILNEVSVALMGHLPLEGLLQLVLDKVFTYLEPDRGLVMLRDETGELKPEVVKFAPGIDKTDIRLSKTLVQAVMERRNGVLFIDTESDARLGTADSIRLQGITSCLAAPLFVDDEVIGLVYLEARLGRKSFGEEDLRLLTSLANTAAIKVQNVRLQEEFVAKQRIEKEMALAWEIQKRLLPERAPDLPHTQLLGGTIPSRTVSGDYYDFVERPDRTVDVVVADVCGKGMGASILAASVESAYQAWAAENFAPDRLCTRLNEFVYRRTNPEKFITMIIALYDPESGSVIYTNAGHNPGILIRKNGTHELLGAHGPPIGLLAGVKYSSGTFTLEPDDLLALYTDGLTEAENPDGDQFGLEKLVAVVTGARRRALADIDAEVALVMSEFAAGTPYNDDRTLVLLRRT